jgi:hypothetical protein
MSTLSIYYFRGIRWFLGWIRHGGLEVLECLGQNPVEVVYDSTTMSMEEDEDYEVHDHAS